MGIDIEVVSKIINAGFGVFVTVAGTFKWFVFGWQYEEQKARADKYEALCWEMVKELQARSSRLEQTT